MTAAALDSIARAFDEGMAIPYLGPGVLSLDGNQLPGSQDALAARLTAKASVPHKIRNNLGAAAQFIENFKHRSTVTNSMAEAFGGEGQPTSLHALLMSLPALPLVVHAWYDDLPQKALRPRSGWGIAQGVSQAEHSGNWVHYYHADGSRAEVEPPSLTGEWKTLLYQPFGSVWPARTFSSPTPTLSKC